MFGIGVIELLILIVLIASIWIFVKLLRNVSIIEAWIVKRYEKRFIAGPSTVRVSYRDHSEYWWLPFPLALIAVLGMYLISNLVFIPVYLGILPRWIMPATDFACTGVAIACIIIGLLIHIRPGGKRKNKYNFLVAGTSILSGNFFYLVVMFVIIANQPMPSRGIPSRPEIDPSLTLWLIISHVLYLVILQIIFSVWVKPPSTEGQPPSRSSNMRRYYSLVRRAGYIFALFSFTAFIYPLLTAYLMFRYVLGERMSHAPILYLRSFHYVEGPTAFGKIVARVASRYGVLFALVHHTQRSLELHSETRLTERAEVAMAPDEAWQNWIEKQMLRASVIIIDYSVATQGLSWELDCAVSLVDPSIIILLNKKGVVIRAPHNVWKMEYKMGPEGEKQARIKLNQHLRTVLLAS